MDGSILTDLHAAIGTNWCSAESFGWNACDNGPKRDLVGDLTASVVSPNIGIRRRDATNMRCHQYAMPPVAVLLQQCGANAASESAFADLSDRARRSGCVALQKAAGLHMGLYLSMYEWYHPLYVQDAANNFTTSRYVDEVYWPQAKEINTKCLLLTMLMHNKQPHVPPDYGSNVLHVYAPEQVSAGSNVVRRRRGRLQLVEVR